MNILLIENQPSKRTVSKRRTICIFVAVIVVGFACFAAPNVFFHISKLNGGFWGINLFITAVFQFATVIGVVAIGLKYLKKDLQYIGLTSRKWQKDALVGAAIGLTWLIIQFAFLIPLTGGADRPDIKSALAAMDGSVTGILSFIALGVVGGGITEEIYNRGFFITVLSDCFNNKQLGTRVAVVFSIIFFAVGHLPDDLIAWIDILVPTLAYTILFLYTGRLTASIVAHALYNCLAILCMYFLYYGS